MENGAGVPVSLGVFEPPLPDTGELCFEPAGDDIDRDAAVCVVVDTGNLLRCDSRIPRPGKQCRDDVELLGVVEEGLREGDGLVLVFLAIQIRIVFFEGWELLTAPYPAMNRIWVRAYSKPTFSAFCAYLTLDS